MSIGHQRPIPNGLIFGPIRLRSLRSLVFRINVSMLATDVNGIWRTIIQTSGNRKVGGSFHQSVREI